jgi:hypothetical protein
MITSKPSGASHLRRCYSCSRRNEERRYHKRERTTTEQETILDHSGSFSFFLFKQCPDARLSRLYPASIANLSGSRRLVPFLLFLHFYFRLHPFPLFHVVFLELFSCLSHALFLAIAPSKNMSTGLFSTRSTPSRRSRPSKLPKAGHVDYLFWPLMAAGGFQVCN